MRHLYFCILFCLIAVTVSPGAELTLNTELKQKLQIELKALREDIQLMDSQVLKLKKDNQEIGANLLDMETWGIAQQEDKDKYYIEAVEADGKRADVQGKLDAEVAHNRVLLARYHRLKAFLGCALGGLFVLLYRRYSLAISAMLVSIAGPWAFLFNATGPLGAFGLGYGIIYLIF
jgi:hypothetical protein